MDEDYILTEVRRAVLEIVNLEAQARKAFLEDADMRDTCCRAYGVLASCYKIPYAEFIQYVSDVKLGVALGFLEIDAFAALDDLIESVRPANIGLRFDGVSDAARRDVLRAAECRTAMARVHIAGGR